MARLITLNRTTGDKIVSISIAAIFTLCLVALAIAGTIKLILFMF